MDLKKKIASVVAAGSILLNLAAPVLALSVTIDGNLSNSDNFVDLDLNRTTNVDQKNDADVDNDVTVSTNTGGNKVKDVAGGDVEVDTGDTVVGVAVNNTLNSNTALVDNCGGCSLTGDFKISNNASNTDNDIKLDQDNEVDVDQKNNADVDNDVDVTAKSGGNKVKDVTGGSTVEVDTGDVTVNPVVVLNKLNANMALVGGDGESGSLSAWVTGNLSKSTNFIDLDFDSKTHLNQKNDADVDNDVAVSGNSGYNSVKDVAGAMATIDTGDVEVGVLVDTEANFNWADTNNCCLVSVDAGIKNNASKTDNDIALDLDDNLDVDQKNDLDCDGYGRPWVLSFWRNFRRGDKCSDVDVTAYTGKNAVMDATSGDDPAVDTGKAEVGVEVMNTGNENYFGSGDFDSFPSTDGGSSVVIDLDFGEVLDMLSQILSLLS